MGNFIMFIFSSPPLSKTVVIIGGGYAGVKAAQALDSKCSVILIEKRSSFLHCVGGLRAIAVPTLESNVLIPLNNTIKRGRVVTAEVISVASEGSGGWVVKLDNGEEIKADSVLLATGASQNMLGRSGDGLKTDVEIKGYFKSQQEKVAKAKKIVIVGGGPVGVEMAGELRYVLDLNTWDALFFPFSFFLFTD